MLGFLKNAVDYINPVTLSKKGVEAISYVVSAAPSVSNIIPSSASLGAMLPSASSVSTLLSASAPAPAPAPLAVIDFDSPVENVEFAASSASDFIGNLKATAEKKEQVCELPAVNQSHLPNAGTASAIDTRPVVTGPLVPPSVQSAASNLMTKLQNGTSASFDFASEHKLAVGVTGALLLGGALLWKNWPTRSNPTKLFADSTIKNFEGKGAVLAALASLDAKKDKESVTLLKMPGVAMIFASLAEATLKAFALLSSNEKLALLQGIKQSATIAVGNGGLEQNNFDNSEENSDFSLGSDAAPANSTVTPAITPAPAETTPAVTPASAPTETTPAAKAPVDSLEEDNDVDPAFGGRIAKP